MRLSLILFLLSPLFYSSTLTAQPADDPFFETRAVWLATVLRDGNWPTTGAPPDQQAEALRGIIRQAHAMGINTFFMQVVARGDAMYPSARLPWSALLKGPGEDPGYDPLAVALEEAHRLGMELHAWFNVFRIGDTSTLSQFENIDDPQHVGFAQPGWVHELGAQVWLDPSSVEARDWLVGNVLEIVENYDIDGIHFDFIRYPQGGFPEDEANFQFDNRGFADLPDWRRGNVNAFVESVSAAISSAKPWVKIGSAPLGNYRETSAWPAFWAYSDAYQESRLWLENGWHDYLAPQIYFSTGTDPEGTNTFSSPDFTVLVNEWVDESANRPIIAGMGVYKPTEGRFPASDLPVQIDHAREAGAAGQAAFRFDHLVEYADLITAKYPYPALPVAMQHRFEAAAPTVPSGLVVSGASGNRVMLSWLASAGAAADPLRSYVILRRQDAPPVANEAADLLVVVDGTQLTFTDSTVTPGQTYYYSVAARSALGVVSSPSDPVSSQVITAIVSEGQDNRATTIVSVFPNPASQNAQVVYYLDAPANVEIILYDTIGRRANRLHTGQSVAGTHRLDVSTGHLANGVYQVVLRAGTATSTWPLMINR